MKQLLMVLIIVALAGSALADVDLIVQAREYWKDGKPTADWTKEDFRDFWQQTHKGEIISALPVKDEHGNDCCFPPIFVTVTVTGVTLEQARAYLEPLIDSAADGWSDSVSVKQRRWHFERRVVDSAITLWETDGSRLVMTKQQAINLIKKYDKATIKQKIQGRLKR